MTKSNRTVSVRNLRVGELIVPRAYEREARIPLVRFKGRWLERAGFRVGSRMKVAPVMPGVLLVSRADLPVMKVPEGMNIWNN